MFLNILVDKGDLSNNHGAWNSLRGYEPIL